MAPYRCYICVNDRGIPGQEFAASPARGKLVVCPRCGLGEHPRDAAMIVKLETIHFDAPTNNPARGVGHAACDAKLMAGAVRLTGEPVAVSCPACVRTEIYRTVAAERGSPPVFAEADFAIEIDPASGIKTTDQK